MSTALQGMGQRGTVLGCCLWVMGVADISLGKTLGAHGVGGGFRLGFLDL